MSCQKIFVKVADVMVLINFNKDVFSQFYTSPLKLFEYMALRRPIVASDLPATRKILNNNNAVLIKPDTPEELGNKIAEKPYQDVRKYTWKNRSRKTVSQVLEA